MLDGLDPAAASALRSCEAQRYGLGLYHSAQGVIAPVPFPGYVFALFAPFAALPYVSACGLWLALLLACLFAAAVLLARLTLLPLWALIVLAGVSYGVAVLALGEVAPIALAALCASAYALRAQRYALAAAALSVAAVLPHVAAPAFLAVLLFEPRARRSLAIAIGVLLLLDLAIGGPLAAVHYFTRVLPAHAQSEIGYIAQYGLTWILHGAGVPDRAAILLGDLSYLIACAAGIICTGVLRLRARDAALLATLPCAFAVIGGPFIHYSEITLAFPGLLLLYVRCGGIARTCCAGAILLLAVPWQWIVGEPTFVLPLSLAATFVICAGLLGAGRDAALRAAFAALLLGAALLFVALHFGPQVQQLHGAAVDSQLAQASWTSYIRARGASTGLVWWLAKLPTWIGLLLLAAGGYYGAVKKDLVLPVVVERTPVVP